MPLSPSGLDIEPGRLVAGVDIGGTKAEAVLIDHRGCEVARSRVATTTGATGVVASVLAAIADAHANVRAASARSPICAVGIGVPGAVDVATGTVARAVNLAVADLPLARLVGGALSCPVIVDNDVNLAAFGLARSLQPPVGSLAFLNLGTGMGAGIVLGGAIVRGTHGAAGEIGHLCFDPSGPRCGCGMNGCLELYASGSGLLRASGGMTASEVFERARRDEATASEIVERFAAALAEAIRMLAQTYDPDVIALGGGVFASLDVFMPRVRAILAQWADASDFVRSLGIGDRVAVVDGARGVAATGAALWAADVPAGTRVAAQPGHEKSTGTMPMLLGSGSGA